MTGVRYLSRTENIRTLIMLVNLLFIHYYLDMNFQTY